MLMDNDHLNIFSKMAIEQSHEDVACIISNMELCSINKISSMNDAKQIYEYLDRYKNNRSSGSAVALRKLASLEASTYPINQELFYTGIIKLARKAQSFIKNKVSQLSRLDALLLIHTLASNNYRKMLFNTNSLFNIGDRTEEINRLLKNIKLIKAHELLSIKSETLINFSKEFKKVINHLNLNFYGIADISSGVSKIDQCQVLITYNLIHEKESSLLSLLEDEDKKFTAFKKITNKTLNSKNSDIRAESVKYVKSLGFSILNTDLETYIFISTYRSNVQTALKKVLEESNKKTSTKKSRIKTEKESPRKSVFIEAGNVEKLQHSFLSTDSKAEIIRRLFKNFIKKPHKEQSALIRKTTVASRKKAKKKEDVDSHQKTDFIISNELNNEIKKLLKKHKTQLQMLTNILVNHAIEQYASVAKHTKKVSENAVTTSAQPHPSTPDTRPPNPYYQTIEEENLTSQHNLVSSEKMKELKSILGKRSF